MSKTCITFIQIAKLWVKCFTTPHRKYINCQGNVRKLGKPFLLIWQTAWFSIFHTMDLVYLDVVGSVLDINSIQSMGLRWPPWCEQSSLNSRSNAHCDGAAMAPLCKLVKRGAVRANDLPLSNDLEAWPDSSVGRDVQSQGSRVRIPLGSVIFSHFHFSY